VAEEACNEGTTADEVIGVAEEVVVVAGEEVEEDVVSDVFEVCRISHALVVRVKQYYVPVSRQVVNCGRVICAVLRGNLHLRKNTRMLARYLLRGRIASTCLHNFPFGFQA